MIYLISQVTFIFLTQIYYNMNFITSSSISSQDFLGTLRSIFANCFWRTFFCSTQKMHISEYVCKTCLKELGTFLKCREFFERFFQPASVLKILVFHNFISKFSGNYFKATYFLNKNQNVYAAFREFKTTRWLANIWQV